MWLREDRPSLRTLLLFIVLVALTACAHLQTHEGKCDEALKKYNNLMTTYRSYYPIQTPEVQAEWKKDIAPKLQTMSKAVDMCPEDVTGYDTAMLVFDTVEQELLKYSIKVMQEGK